MKTPLIKWCDDAIADHIPGVWITIRSLRLHRQKTQVLRRAGQRKTPEQTEKTQNTAMHRTPH